MTLSKLEYSSRDKGVMTKKRRTFRCPSRLSTFKKICNNVSFL